MTVAVSLSSGQLGRSLIFVLPRTASGKAVFPNQRGISSVPGKAGLDPSGRSSQPLTQAGNLGTVVVNLKV